MTLPITLPVQTPLRTLASHLRTGLLGVLLICLALPALAHFAQNLVVRVFLAEAESPTHTVIYQDVPVPMLFADLLADVAALPRDDPSALLYADMRGGQGQIRLSREAIAADPAAFEARLAGNLTWHANGQKLDPELIGWHLSALEGRRDWQNAEQARADVARPSQTRENPEIASATIQFALRLPAGPDAQLTTLLAGPALTLPPGVQIDTHVTDLRGDQPLIFATTGQLDTALTISPGLIDRIIEFIVQGVAHVFTGLDHVFLIICVALAPLTLGPLIWRLTAFTLGHSITLIAAAMGWVPAGETFISWVEFVIALTIIYAAVEALRRKSPSAIALFSVGLVHGFGFASVLSVILGPGSPAFVASLLAFNVGIELAQIVIVLAVLGILWIIRQTLRPAEDMGTPADPAGRDRHGIAVVRAKIPGRVVAHPPRRPNAHFIFPEKLRGSRQ